MRLATSVPRDAQKNAHYIFCLNNHNFNDYTAVA